MNGQIIVTGANVLANPNIGTNSSGGNDGQGTMRIEGGQQAFDADDIIVFDVQNVDANGEVTGASGFIGISVFEDADAFLNGDPPKFTYEPQNPGQTATVQPDLSGLGDGYVRFNANVLISDDPGAPSFNQLIVAGGRDLVSEIEDGPVLFSRNQDFDFDGDGTIDTGTIEEGNNFYATATNIFTPICFAEGTPILTPEGYRAIETLSAGDRVITRDHGAQPIAWHGKRTTAGTGTAAPIGFRPGAIGNRATLRLSPNHRVLITGARAQLTEGTDEILVPAKALINDLTIRPAPCAAITYHHLLFEDHEIIDAAGAWVESLHAGAEALDTLTAASRAEILDLFPELEARPMARPALRSGEARVYGKT